MAANGESVGTYGDNKLILDGNLSMGSNVSKTFDNMQNSEPKIESVYLFTKKY